MSEQKIYHVAIRKIGKLVTLEPFSFNRLREFYRLYQKTSESWEEFLFLGFNDGYDVREFINQRFTNPLFTGFFIVVDRKVVGFILGECDEVDDKVVMITYAVAKEFENKGYASEAIQMFEELLKDADFSVILSGCTSDNVKSKHLMEKSGYQYLETRTMQFVFDKVDMDYYFKVLS